MKSSEKNYPFTRVVIVNDDGQTEEMSTEKFLMVPIYTRVKLMLAERLKFYDGEVHIDSRTAIESLQKWKTAKFYKKI